MATAKTVTLAFRIDPGLKETLHAVVQHEHRSKTNMEELVICESRSNTGPRKRSDDLTVSVVQYCSGIHIRIQKTYNVAQQRWL